MSSLPCLFLSIEPQTLDISSTRPSFDPTSCGCIILNQKTKVRGKHRLLCVPGFESEYFIYFKSCLDSWVFFTIVPFYYLNNTIDLLSPPLLQYYPLFYQPSFPPGKSLPFGNYHSLTRYLICNRSC